VPVDEARKMAKTGMIEKQANGKYRLIDVRTGFSLGNKEGKPFEFTYDPNAPRSGSRLKRSEALPMPAM
jgi:hypothetical protein